MNPTQQQFILHIEDDHDDQLMLIEAVQRAGSSLGVLSAKNGQEGLEHLVQCSTKNHLPALIILDLNLPGMDGKRVVTEIRKCAVLSSIPLAILTTSSSELDRLFASKYGIQFYTKPSCEAEFFEIVRSILESGVQVKE